MSEPTPSTSIDPHHISMSWAVVVDADGPWPQGVAVVEAGTIPGLDAAALRMLTRPDQLWIVVGDHPQLEEVLRLADTATTRSSADDVLRHLADHAAARHRIADERLVEAMREVAILRRELNSALSALSTAHPVLGLMPSVSDTQFRAEREPAVPLKPWDPDALMTARRHPNLSDDEIADLQDEVTDLRSELEAIRGTRLMRWSDFPRRAYRSLRSGSSRPQGTGGDARTAPNVTADLRR